MNINCIICSDLFVPASAIYVTQCGHIFHYTCLIQWIERSKTCPQCRNKISEKSIFRVYFNIITLEGIEDDAVTLQSKLDAANLQLRLKKGHIKSTEEKIKTITDEKTALILDSKFARQELDKSKSDLRAVKERLTFYKDKAQSVEKMENELRTLKEQFQIKDQALRALTGDLEEATSIIQDETCPKTLSVIASTLKKEMLLLEKKKNNYFTSMKRAEKELHSCRKELDSVSVERNKLKIQLNEHKKCEQDMGELKQKISEMMDTTTSVDPALVRIATESPAPRIRSRLMGVSSTSHTESPTIADRVKEIKESDSPYLKIRSTSVGLSMKSQVSGPRFGSTEISIFKKTLYPSTMDDLTVTSIKKPLADYSYDGFGGHSKDEKFPTTGIKRTKTSMSSNKFKKLAKPNKKLDEFLNISDID